MKKAKRGDSDDPGGEAVEPVDEVHRVGRRDDDHDREEHEDGGGQDGRPGDRQRQQLHTGVGHQAGGEDLPGQLGQPVELANVVEGPDEAHDAARREHPEDLAVPEEGAEVRQVARDECRGDEADVDSHSPEPRDGSRVDVTLADSREGTRGHGEAAHEGCRDVRDRGRDEKDQDVLVHSAAQ